MEADGVGFALAIPFAWSTFFFVFHLPIWAENVQVPQYLFSLSL